MSKGTILVVGSNATKLEAKGGGTILIGQFLNETAIPIMALVAAGYSFVLATSSAGVAWALGFTDGDMMPPKLLAELTARITNAISIPLSVDFEGGYTKNPQKIGENLKPVIDAGAVGINIEDGETVITSRHVSYAPTNDLVLLLRRRGIEKMIMAGAVANLCLEDHMRKLIENGF